MTITMSNLFFDFAFIDHTLDDSDFEFRCRLDNGRHLVQPKESLGQLDILPPELISQIFLLLDIPTLTALRRVNHRTMNLIDSLPQYRVIFELCPNVLRAIICVEATFFDCRTLYQTLSTSKCETCRRFGMFLYLITCRRVCCFCFYKYYAMSVIEATEHLLVSEVDLLRLPLPRISTRHPWDCGLLFDRDAVYKTVLDPSFTLSLVEYEDFDEATRRLTFISAPYLNSTNQLAEWGHYCRQCDNCDELSESFAIENTVVRETKGQYDGWGVKHVTVCGENNQST
ncbi:hypothetical protein F4805DRAFT_36205 [Annulohypoxylon moriforme]|nr:hypothetical protein F4805DRAFT_36205 [Annulohypoxylon moriforme]